MGLMQALLRPGLLDGTTIAFAGCGDALAAAREACMGLGARTPVLDVDLLDEEAVTAAAAALMPSPAATAIAATAATAPSAPAPSPAPSAPVPSAPAPCALVYEATDLRAVDGAWNAIRAVATMAWIEHPERAGKVVLIGPPDDVAARAALENLARTLSIEWARYGIVTTAVLPGAATTAGEVAQLAAYLVSPAGDYASGCAFTLGAVASTRPA
jgi:NAD(P)-dependent dehydrogenase (short-subunit alcohol dehydrogenase family)